MAILATYYFLISLIGLALPISLMLGFRSSLSLVAILGFLILHLVFSLIAFLFIAPALFYFSSDYSFKNQLIAILYILLFISITTFLINNLPPLVPLWLLFSLPIGSCFTYLY